MTDIFSEIDEDLRKDQLNKLWKRYGNVIIALALVLVAGVAGWRGYGAWQQAEAAKFGDRFVQAVQLGDSGKHDEAVAALEQLTREGIGAYPVLARLRAASELAAAGKTDDAVKGFDAVAGDNSTIDGIRAIARIRAAMLLVDQGPVSEVARRIEALATGQGPFRHSARELLGLAALKAGDQPTAVRWFNEVVTDPAVPQDAKRRSSLALDLLAADGVLPASPGVIQ